TARTTDPDRRPRCRSPFPLSRFPLFHDDYPHHEGMWRAVVGVGAGLVEAVDIRAIRRNGRRSSLDAVERDRVLDRVAVDPAHGLTGGDRDRITDELDARYPHFGGNRRAGWAADGDGFRRLVEPGAEPLQVQRDRELEAVEDAGRSRRRVPDRRSLDGRTRRVARLEGKRVRGSWDEKV